MTIAPAERPTFDVASHAAGRLLDGEPDLTVFSTWALAFVRGHDTEDRRHAALDGPRGRRGARFGWGLSVRGLRR